MGRQRAVRSAQPLGSPAQRLLGAGRLGVLSTVQKAVASAATAETRSSHPSSVGVGSTCGDDVDGGGGWRRPPLARLLQPSPCSRDVEKSTACTLHYPVAAACLVMVLLAAAAAAPAPMKPDRLLVQFKATPQGAATASAQLAKPLKGLVVRRLVGK